MKTISSLTQDDDHKSSGFILLIWECGKVDRRVAKGNKELWYFGLYRNKYNIWNSTKSFMQLTRSGGHRISRCRGEILPKYQRQFKALKENKEVLRNQRVSNRDMLQAVVHSDVDVIPTDMLSRKRRNLSSTFSAESN